MFSIKTCLAIEKNREDENYLNLEIAESIVAGAGLGLKVTVDVPKNTIILSYIGKIKAHYEVSAKK